MIKRNTPKAISITPNEDFLEKTKVLQLPIIFKPTDSSGSKGISNLLIFNELVMAINNAYSYSRNNWNNKKVRLWNLQ